MTLILVYTLSKTILGHSFFNYILVSYIENFFLLFAPPTIVRFCLHSVHCKKIGPTSLVYKRVSGIFALYKWIFTTSCPEINGHGATRGRPPTQLLHTVFAIRDREFLVVTLNPCYVCKLPGLFMILCYLTFLWSLHY